MNQHNEKSKVEYFKKLTILYTFNALIYISKKCDNFVILLFKTAILHNFDIVWRKIYKAKYIT